MSKAKHARIDGFFRIIHMDEWDQDYVDVEIDAYIRFEKNGGEFEFGYIQGDMDCEHTVRDGKPAIEWSWDGDAEEDHATGRGWAVLRDDGLIEGKIYIHCGDNSGFTATNKKKKG